MAELANFFRNFKPDSRVLRTFIYDLAFYTLLISIFLFFLSNLKSSTLMLENLDTSTILTSNLDVANSNLAVLQSALTGIIKSLSILFLLFLLVFTLLKGLIWTHLTKSRFTLKYYFKTLLSNLLFLIFFLSIFILLALNLENNSLALLTIPLFLHFNSLSYIALSKGKKIFSSIGFSVRFTFTKFPKYILSYIASIILLVIAALASREILAFISSSLQAVLFPILLIFYVSIFRNYFTKLVSSTEK